MGKPGQGICGLGKSLKMHHLAMEFMHNDVDVDFASCLCYRLVMANTGDPQRIWGPANGHGAACT